MKKWFASLLFAIAAHAIAASSSCTDFTPNAAGGGTFYIPSSTFDPTTNPPNCIPPAIGSGKKPDLAISIIFPDNTDCPTAPPIPANVAVTIARRTMCLGWVRLQRGPPGGSRASCWRTE